MKESVIFSDEPQTLLTIANPTDYKKVASQVNSKFRFTVATQKHHFGCKVLNYIACTKLEWLLPKSFKGDFDNL